ncbi:MAG: hypothetical protein HXY43_01995 [Fischerella sp.]|jgi:hypothetical protein|uniref:hypothetical protein n=1 Tax=Fischerella sp. TaxID=1191 RepID=UPI001852B055|nr:hypothetical protein [Fischerella sp.]NWF58106.1 hypothetical protein [Fischerella sp.]
MTEDLKFYYSKYYLNGKQIKADEIEGYTQHFNENELIGQTLFDHYVVESVERVLPTPENAQEFAECSKIIKYPVDEIWRIHLKQLVAA